MILNINGKDLDVDVEENMPLLWVLRDELNMTGTKYGCGVASCGACNVIIDGVTTRSCVSPVSRAIGTKIKTIEGIESEQGLSIVQKAWIAEQVPQCGYCQSGMIVAAEQLLKDHPDPTDEEIDLAITNICRCGTYGRIRTAIKLAAKMRDADLMEMRSDKELLD